MDVSYRKDLLHSYLVIPMPDNSSDEAYCVSMLQANSIEGIINPEPRNIDNRVLYYYDITSKQSIETIYIKNTLKYNELKSLFTDLADLIEQTYEYLLNENDLILKPEHIYIDLTTGKASVSYLPGYNKNMGTQMTMLIEYLMNKVEYNDKDAVLYIYNLYAACRGEGFSFSTLLSAIRDSKTENKSLVEENIKERRKDGENKNIISEDLSEAHKINKTDKPIPFMMEKITDEKELYYYPLSTYIYTGACIIAAICVIIIAVNMRIVYTSIGNRIDYGKLMALVLILVISDGYLIKHIWNKNNRLTKIVSKHEYIDPRTDYNTGVYAKENHEQINKTYEYDIADKKSEDICRQEDKSDLTVLLNAKSFSYECCLEPENKEVYDVIQITDFPFVIGKLRDNVDYCLDNDVVSRFHVKITKEENDYYITDLNSTNGTTVNEKALSCYQRYKLDKGDKVAIAGINYIFYVS